MGEKSGNAWNEVEKKERRKDSSLAREIEVALPRELDGATQETMLREFVERQFNDKGMVADVAIHTTPASDGNTNPMHIFCLPYVVLMLKAGTNTRREAKIIPGTRKINYATGVKPGPNM